MIDSGEGYRFLNVGEFIKVGDEAIINGKWEALVSIARDAKVARPKFYRRKVESEGYVHCDCGWAGETHEALQFNRCPECTARLHEGIGPVGELFRSPKDKPQTQEDFW